MTNDLTNVARQQLAKLNMLKSSLSNVTSTIQQAGGDPILRLLRDGVWVYGQEDLEIEPGSLWAMNPFDIQHGWVCWTRYETSTDPAERKKKNEIVHEVLVSATQPLPPMDSLPKTAWPYNQQVQLVFRCLNGTDAGVQVRYKPSSVGGMTAAKGLIDAMMQHLDFDADTPVPVVELKIDSYTHKQYGRTYTPVLEIAKWIAMPDDVASAQAAVAEAPPARQVEAQPVEAQPAPARGRRRSAAEVADQPADAPQAETTGPVAAFASDIDAQIAALMAQKEAAARTTAPATAPAPATNGDAPIRRRRNTNA